MDVVAQIIRKHVTYVDSTKYRNNKAPIDLIGVRLAIPGIVELATAFLVGRLTISGSPKAKDDFASAAIDGQFFNSLMGLADFKLKTWETEDGDSSDNYHILAGSPHALSQKEWQRICRW